MSPTGEAEARRGRRRAIAWRPTLRRNTAHRCNKEADA
jgi:hypothetical protein